MSEAGFPPPPQTVIRAVIDTSALVPGDLRRRLQLQAEAGAYIAIWSPWIIGELHRVLTWRWLKRSRDFSESNWIACSGSSKAMMEYLIAVFETVAPVPPYPSAWPGLRDQWDIPVWAAAKLSNAHFIVSENTKDFPPANEDGVHVWEGIQYVRGQDFLNILRDGLQARHSHSAQEK